MMTVDFLKAETEPLSSSWQTWCLLEKSSAFVQTVALSLQAITFRGLLTKHKIRHQTFPPRQNEQRGDGKLSVMSTRLLRESQVPDVPTSAYVTHHEAAESTQ